MVKRFDRQELESSLYSLEKDGVMKYPANGYFTMRSARISLWNFELRVYKDEAISKTHRQIKRIK